MIVEEDLTEDTVLSDQVAPDVMRNTIEAVGFAYSTDLKTGQALVESNRESPGLANSIEPGRRAYPLLVDETNMVAGQIRDDDHVDVIFTTHVLLTRVNPTYPLEVLDQLELQDAPGDSVRGEGGRPAGASLPEYGSEPEGPTYPYPGEDGSRFWVSDVVDGDPVGKLILQNVRVLRVVTASLDEAATQDESDFLILDLSPAEAELVRYLIHAGTYQIVLRGPDDTEIVETSGATMNILVDNWGLTVPKTVRLPEAGAQ